MAHMTCSLGFLRLSFTLAILGKGKHLTDVLVCKIRDDCGADADVFGRCIHEESSRGEMGLRRVG